MRESKTSALPKSVIGSGDNYTLENLGYGTFAERQRAARRLHRQQERSRIRSELLAWLMEARVWDLFVTLTWDLTRRRGGYLSRAAAFVQVSRFLHDLSVVIYGPRYAQRLGQGLDAFIAFEKHTSGELHVHVLIAGWRGTRYELVHELWQRRAGFAWVRRCSPHGIRYTVKYATKGGGTYEFWGDWKDDPQLTFPVLTMSIGS